MNKWNLTKEKGERIAHKYITNILNSCPSKKMPYRELSISLNQRTKHIKVTQGKKRKPFLVYLNDVYGSLENFLDDYIFYGIMNTDVIFLEGLMESEHTKLSQWELVTEEEEESYVLL